MTIIEKSLHVLRACKHVVNISVLQQSTPPRCSSGWRVLSAVVQISHALPTISQEQLDVPRQENREEEGGTEGERSGGWESKRERRGWREGERDTKKGGKKRSAKIDSFNRFSD